MTKEYLLWITIGYCSGSVLYAYLIPRVFTGIDIREGTEDQNPGTANAFVKAGVPCGIFAVLCELLKGFLPVWEAAKRLGIAHPAFALVLLAPVLGHAFPLLGRFPGGKGIAVSFGVLLGLFPSGVWQPAVLLAFFYITYSIVIVISPHRIRSIAAFGSFIAWAVLTRQAMVSGCVLIGCLVILRHMKGHEEPQEAVRPKIHLALTGRDRKGGNSES